jgi:hypothetical protein
MSESFRMRPAPEMCSDETINQLVDAGFLAPTAPHSEPGSSAIEHPTASWLYRKFRVGGNILTKEEAYGIGNELDRLHRLVKELQRESPDEAPLPAREREVENAVDDALHREAFPNG